MFDDTFCTVSPILLFLKMFCLFTFDNYKYEQCCFFLETADGYLHLKEDSDYYHQIQGQLYITKKKCCDLIVWTPTDLAIIRMVKDINWSANIEKLIDFYFEKFIPEVNKK